MLVNYIFWYCQVYSQARCFFPSFPDGSVSFWVGVYLTVSGFTLTVSSEAGPRLLRAYHVTWWPRVQTLLSVVRMLDPTTPQQSSPLALSQSSRGSLRRKMSRKYSVERVSVTVYTSKKIQTYFEGVSCYFSPKMSPPYQQEIHWATVMKKNTL